MFIIFCFKSCFKVCVSIFITRTPSVIDVKLTEHVEFVHFSVIIYIPFKTHQTGQFWTCFRNKLHLNPVFKMDKNQFSNLLQ